MKRLLAIAAVALAACQSMAPQSPPLPYPAQRIYQSSYSFMPPNEPGWLTLARYANQLAFFKPGINADESFAIQGALIPLPEYRLRDEFVEIIKKRLAEEAADPRYKVLRHDMIPETAQANSCLRSHFAAEDHAAVKRTATPGIMVLEAMARFCVHPKNANLAVRVGYSHRRYPEHADPKFAEKAEQMLSSLEFLE